jgi:plasmid stabilization system protein ParE
MTARISARARGDLDRIFAYISARQGSKAADRFLELAQEAAEFLVQHPLAGPHPRWATRHKTLRFWVISRTNFLIYYLPDEHGVSIERVLDGRRDVARIIELGREEPPDWECSAQT